MVMTDPIADMLTRIRNAYQRKYEKVDMPCSKLKMEIARVLKEEGYISNFKKIESSGNQQILRIFLKYGPNKERVFTELKRISKPGRRIYRKWHEIPKIRSGLGTIIVSTSKGIMTDKEARKRKLGGELICSIF